MQRPPPTRRLTTTPPEERNPRRPDPWRWVSVPCGPPYRRRFEIRRGRRGGRRRCQVSVVGGVGVDPLEDLLHPEPCTVDPLTAPLDEQRSPFHAGSEQVDVGGQAYVIGGDVIVKADDTEIASFNDLVAFLGTRKPGDTVTLTLVDKNGTRTVQATLVARPAG